MELIRDDIDLTGYLGSGDAVHKVKPASSWLQGVVDHFYRPKDAARFQLPWAKCAGDFEFRSGEVSIWAGINGHGKSQMVGMVALHLMRLQRVLVISLEMSPTRTMARMCRQAAGHAEPSIDFLKRFHAWTDGRMWIYDHVGPCDVKTVLAVIRYAVDHFGIEHVVIDNLTKIVPGEDSYNEQKDFVNSLCSVAHDLDIHCHLVMHVRKGKDENEIPNKFSIRGSAACTDLVDNVFIVWRNKAKEKDTREGDLTRIEEPDAILVLDKQRNGETEGAYQFWFHNASLQYLENRHALPTTVEMIDEQA